MVPAGNKAKCLSPVNHTTKTIYHQTCSGDIKKSEMIKNIMKGKFFHLAEF